MILTLLVDLDDTLLENDTDIFVPAYLKSLAGYIADFYDPGIFIKQLLASTQLMMKNNDPEQTLKESFDKSFFPSLGTHQINIAQAIDVYYQQVFPKLQSQTKPVPAAAYFIQEALDRHYRIVIATNPLFPRSAILERMKWAGLPADEYSFEIITTYEDFHFAKPNPAYYAEILARLGWPEGPVIMVGNDLDADIQPAQKLGLATYQVCTQNGSNGHHSSGSLDHFFEWLDKTPEQLLLPTYDTALSAIASLRATPAILPDLLGKISGEIWRKRPAPSEWALVEVMCHLRDVEEEVNLPRLRLLLDDKVNPFIPAADPDPWAADRKYLKQDGPAASQCFMMNRKCLLEILDTLDVESWQRMARHSIFGPTSLEEIVTIMAGHDRLHIRQLQKTLHLVT